MKAISALLVSAALMSAGHAAEQGAAATLQDIDGKVLMSKGDGLVAGKVGTGLMEGDRIVTLNASGARIVFTNGCTVTLEENKIFVINAELGCKAVPMANNPAPVTGLPPGQGLLIVGGFGGAAAGIYHAAFKNNPNDNSPLSRQ